MTPDEQAQFISVLAAILYPQVVSTTASERAAQAISLAAALYAAAQYYVKQHPLE